MNWFALEQHWNLLEIYSQNKLVWNYMKMSYKTWLRKKTNSAMYTESIAPHHGSQEFNISRMECMEFCELALQNSMDLKAKASSSASFSLR